MSEDLTKKLPKTDSEKISLILTTVQALETRVTNLENRVEERLYDTRPIWQKVVADIAQLQDGQRQLQEGQTRLASDVHEMRGEVHEIKVSIRDIYLKMEVFNDTMLNVQAKHRDVDLRVRELEAKQQKPTNSST